MCDYTYWLCPLISTSASEIWHLEWFVYVLSVKQQMEFKTHLKVRFWNALYSRCPELHRLFLIWWPNYSKCQIPDSRRRCTDHILLLSKRKMRISIFLHCALSSGRMLFTEFFALNGTWIETSVVITTEIKLWLI